MSYKDFRAILEKEMVPALGCTDPIGIAFCAAYARKYCRGEVRCVDAFFSKNLIKNAASVIIPGTDNLHGTDIAVALGLVYGNPDDKLKLLDGLDNKSVSKAMSIIESGKIKSHVADTSEILYMKIHILTDEDDVSVTVKDGYTNICDVTINGQHIYGCDTETKNEESLRYDLLNLASILDFATSASIEEMAIVQEGLRMNIALSEAGQSGNYGANTGTSIKEKLSAGSENNMAYSAMIWSSAGVDARMSGCPLPAMSNTGSGNQGIVSTLPVYGASRVLNSSWEQTVRAACISCLVTIYIKSKLGPLSTVCGCVVAGAASSCGIVFLQGGGYDECLRAIKNMFGNLAGMICDGAKASCALKTATCINAACMSADLALSGYGLDSSNGIVGKTEKDTVEFFVRSSKEGLAAMDDVILDIMMNK